MKWAISSVLVRALARQARGHWFESSIAHLASCFWETTCGDLHRVRQNPLDSVVDRKTAPSPLPRGRSYPPWSSPCFLTKGGSKTGRTAKAWCCRQNGRWMVRLNGEKVKLAGARQNKKSAQGRHAASRETPLRGPRKSGSTPRPTGRKPEHYNSRATLISYRSCLKPVDTFRCASSARCLV